MLFGPSMYLGDYVLYTLDINNRLIPPWCLFTLFHGQVWAIAAIEITALVTHRSKEACQHPCQLAEDNNDLSRPVVKSGGAASSVAPKSKSRALHRTSIHAPLLPGCIDDSPLPNNNIKQQHCYLRLRLSWLHLCLSFDPTPRVLPCLPDRCFSRLLG